MFELRSAHTGVDAIRVITDGVGTNDPGAIIEGNFQMNATDGGGVTLSGRAKAGVAGLQVGSQWGGGVFDALSTTGNINMDAGTNSISFQNAASAIYLGSKSGSVVTAATGNIVMTADSLSLASALTYTNTTGTLTIAPTSASFSSAVNSTGWVLGTDLSALTVGKTTNTANITWASSNTVNGPITIYGGNITLDSAIGTTNVLTGDVLLRGADINSAYNISLATGRTLTLDTTGSSLLSGIVSGTSANLVKQGAGAVYLRGVNSYSGLTTISAGYLELNTAGSLVTDVVNNASFGFNQTADYTFANTISGTGYLVKYGSNTLTLTANNTYTDANYLYGGTLSVASLANGGELSNIGQSSNAAANLVINNATLKYTGAAISTDRLFTLGDSGATVDASGTGALVFANTGALAYSGTAGRLLTLTGNNIDDNTMAPVLANNAGISSFTKAGTGKWVMKAANTYSGLTTISGGTLNVGDGADALASLGTNTVSIAAGATLNFDHSADVMVANAISGAGQLNKLGGNTLSLTGVNSYTGATGTGSAGGVVYTNNTAPSTVGFTGSGAVTIEPASNSFGALVTGNYTFDSTISGLTLGKSGNLTNVTLNSLVAIAGPITVYAPQITVNQALSSTGAGLTLNGASVLNGGSVTVAGFQAYNGGVTLGAATTLTSTGSGAITFSGTLNGAHTLAVDTAGVTTFNGAVGNLTALTSLTTNTGGSVVINGGVVNTTGAQTFNEVVSLGADTVLRGVNVALMSSVDGAQALTIYDSGTTVLGGNIGDTTPLTSLTTDSLTTAAGETHIKGASIHTTTDAVFNDIVKIFTDVKVQAGSQITFVQTVDGNTAGMRSLTLNGGNSGTVNFQGAVGATGALKTLEVVNSGATTFIGPVSANTSVLLTDTTNTIAFNGGLTTPTLTVAAEPFALTLRGNLAVTNAVILANTGFTQLGAMASDNLHFVGGLVATAPSGLGVAGTLRSTNATILLGRSDASMTLLNNTTINSGSGTLRLASSVAAGEGAYVLQLLSTGPTTIDGNLSSAGSMSFVGPVTFTNAATLSAASFDFGNTVNFGGTTSISANSVTLDGAVSVAGSLTVNGNTTLNGGSVNSGSFTQTYNGTVNVGGADTSTTTFTGVGITFGNTLDATSRLLVNDSGATTYAGAIGLTQAPAHFETDATGSSTFSGGTLRTSSPNSIYIADDAVVTAALTTFDTTNNGALATGANITFAKTLNGSSNNGQAVTINAGTAGEVLLSGTVGNLQPLSTLSLLNSNGATFNSAVSTGTSVVLTDTSDGQIIRFNGSLSTPLLSTTTQPYVLELLGTSTSITGASVTNFANTGALKLGNLESDTLSFTGGLTATAASSISVSGLISTSGVAAMTVGDANTGVTLLNHASLTTGGAALTIGGAVEGTTANTQSLTLNAGSTGAVSVLGTLGLNTPIKTLTLTHSNGATFTGEVKANTSVVLSDTSATRDVTFVANLTTPLLSTSGSAFNLKLLGANTAVAANTVFNNTGTLTLGDAATDTLIFTGGLTATAPSHINMAGHISTSGAGVISLGDAGTAMTLTDHAWLTTGGAALTLGGAVEGSTADAQSLTMDATATGALNVASTVGLVTPLKTLTLVHSNGATFSGEVKANTSVVLTDTTAARTISFADDLTTPTLTTTGSGYNLELLGAHTTVSNGAVFNQTGTLTLGDAATDALLFTAGLTATASSNISAAGQISTTNAAVIFGTAPMVLTDDVSVNAGSGTVSFGGTINTASALAAKSLTVNSTGATTFTAALGNSSALSDLLTNVGGTLAINGGAVNTTGAQSYGEAVSLGADTVLTSTGGGAISFSTTIDGAQTLVINTTGATTLGGAVGSGAGTALTSLTTNSGGSLAINGGSVITTGAQSYGEAVRLGEDTVLTSTAGEAISFASTIDTASGVLAKSLQINTIGTTLLSGAIGVNSPLSSLTTDADGMLLLGGGTVTTTGAQIYHDMVSILRNSTLTASAVTFDNAVMGSGFLHVVGDANLNGGNISTTLGQSYSAAVMLGANTTLTSTNAGDIVFASTLDGGYNLAINTAGNTSFNGAIGAMNALRSVHTNLGGRVLLNAGSVTTTGAQTYDDFITLGANAALTSSGGAAIQFAKALDGAYDLTVDTAGMTTIAGTVDVRSLSVTGPSTHTGGAVTTTQAQIYGSAITLGANTSLISSLNTIQFTHISDATGSYNLNMQSHTAQVLAPMDIGGNLHVTTRAGGVSQLAGSSLNVGGTSTFTADTGTLQVAALTSANNTFTGLLMLDQVNSGSWADVSVTTDSPLSLAPLQSAGSVNLQTQGALTTSTITASGNLTANSQGGAVSMGAATVSGDLTVQSGGGSLVQTGQFVVTGNTTVATGTGTITLDNELNSFAGTLGLQGVSTTVATSGNLQLASVTNSGPMTLRTPTGSIDLGTAFITGGDLTLESRDDMNLGGANITGSLNMSSTEGTVSFGQATVTGNLTATTEGQQVDLGSATVGGNLLVQSQGGNIVQSTASNSALQVTGTSNLNAGTGNVDLSNVPNQFGDAVSLQANNVTLGGSNGLILGSSNVTGTLAVTAATGNITQTGELNVTGTSAFTATQGDVLLTQANTFAQSVSVVAVNASLNAATALILEASTVTEAMVVTVAAGDVTQLGPLTIGGATNITASAGNVTLTDAANSFSDTVSVDTSGTLKLTSGGPLTLGIVKTVGDTDLKSVGILDLGTSIFGAKINANSGGFDIIQSGPIKVGGNSNFDAGSAKIDLFNPKNSWSGSILYKGGTVMINHPQLLNAINAGTLAVRVQTPVVQPVKVSAPSAVASGTSAVSIAVTRPASNGQTGLITVAVSSEVAAPGRSFSFSIESQIPATAVANTEVLVTQVDGRPLPEWLRYEAATKTFVATSVPPGAFPLQLKVGIGGVETLMVINEKPPGN